MQNLALTLLISVQLEQETQLKKCLMYESLPCAYLHVLYAINQS
jgi:hypothetical protein